MQELAPSPTSKVIDSDISSIMRITRFVTPLINPPSENSEKPIGENGPRYPQALGICTVARMGQDPESPGFGPPVATSLCVQSGGYLSSSAPKGSATMQWPVFTFLPIRS